MGKSSEPEWEIALATLIQAVFDDKFQEKVMEHIDKCKICNTRFYEIMWHFQRASLEDMEHGTIQARKT